MSSASDYVKPLGRRPLLSADEERDLHRQQTPASRERLIQGQFGWGITLAIRYRAPGIDTADLIASAIVGVIDAVDTWEPDRCRLNTWVFYQARKRIQRAVRDHRGGAPRRKADGTQIVHQSLDDGLIGRDGTREDVAVPDHREPAAEYVAEVREEVRAVNEILATMRPRRVEILRAHVDGETFTAIGNRLGMTFSGARQHYAAALREFEAKWQQRSHALRRSAL